MGRIQRLGGMGIKVRGSKVEPFVGGLEGWGVGARSSTDLCSVPPISHAFEYYFIKKNHKNWSVSDPSKLQPCMYLYHQTQTINLHTWQAVLVNRNSVAL